MKRVSVIITIVFLALLPLVLAVGGGGGGDSGSGGSTGSSTGASGGTTFSAITCYEDGSITLQMYKPQNITATFIKTNKRIEAPGTWDSSGNFRSQELLFKEPGDYNITNDQGITRIFTCPGFKFACSIVSILNAYCIKNESGIFSGFDIYNDSSIENLKFNYGLDQKILSYEKNSYSPELKNLSIKKDSNKIVIAIPVNEGIKTFEVIHKKCLGKRYIYSRVNCTEFASLSSIDPNALKCGGLLDLKDRVRCRVNLEKEKNEYENFFPEECRTRKNPTSSTACYNLYRTVSPCWAYPSFNERYSCLKEKVEIDKAQNKQEKNERLLTLIKLRFYNLEEQAEMLEEKNLLNKEDIIDFVVQIELKKQAFNQAKTKEEMKQIIQDVRNLWTSLMKTRKGESNG